MLAQEATDVVRLVLGHHLHVEQQLGHGAKDTGPRAIQSARASSHRHGPCGVDGMGLNPVRRISAAAASCPGACRVHSRWRSEAVNTASASALIAAVATPDRCAAGASSTPTSRWSRPSSPSKAMIRRPPGIHARAAAVAVARGWFSSSTRTRSKAAEAHRHAAPCPLCAWFRASGTGRSRRAITRTKALQGMAPSSDRAGARSALRAQDRRRLARAKASRRSLKKALR